VFLSIHVGVEAKFKEVSEAYAVLSDKSKRAQYDQFGQYQAGGAQGGFGGAGFEGFDFSNFQNGGFQGGFSFNGQEFDLGDIFGEVFGNRGASRSRARGRDISIDIELTFKESILGTERRMLIAKVGTCDVCDGSGAQKGSATKNCATCNGKGEIRETRNTFFGNFTSARACPNCNGRGTVPEKPCASCRGDGVRKREEEIGAANTIINSNGKIIAYNTDWLAARNLLSRFDNKTIYILGNGGYSKAVQYAAKSLKKETKVIARANWTDLYFLTGQVIFNATPLKDLKLNESNTFIDCHVGTGTGTELALIQAAHQFKLYTGIDFPSEYIKTLL
jgi:hypothetical protein